MLVGDPDRLENDTVRRLDAVPMPQINLGPLTMVARASIGTVVLRPESRTTAEEVLSAADTRMHAAKRQHHQAAQRSAAGTVLPTAART